MVVSSDSTGGPSKAEELVERVRTLSKPVAEELGLELVDVEFTTDRAGRILRVYIDRPGGVNIDDCTRLSRELGMILDVEDVIDFNYSLEVSSPGLDRPLVREKDFFAAIGKKVKLRTKQPVDGRRSFKVVVERVAQGTVTVVDSDGESCQIEIANILKARRVIEI